jgi:hypothetical protein
VSNMALRRKVAVSFACVVDTVLMSICQVLGINPATTAHGDSTLPGLLAQDCCQPEPTSEDCCGIVQLVTPGSWATNAWIQPLKMLKPQWRPTS